MGEYSFLLAIAVVFMFGTMSPGPSFILVAKTAVSKPFSEGICVSIGLSLGAVFFTLLAIFGLYALFEAVPFLFGFLTQISNPKTAIILGSIFAALLPQQLPAYGELLLCLLAFFVDAIWYCAVVLLLSTKKSQKVYLRFKKYIDRVAGTLLAGLGLKLAVDHS